MAAPVRIEARAWSDLRFATLARLLGLADADHALIKVARLWSWQTEHYTADRPTYVVDRDTIESVLGERGPEALVRAKLATETPDGWRMHGTEGAIEWCNSLAEKRSRAGQARAAGARRGDDGRMIGNNRDNHPAHAGHAGPAQSSTSPAQSSAEETVEGRAEAENSRLFDDRHYIGNNRDNHPAHAGHAGPAQSSTSPAQSSAPDPSPDPSQDQREGASLSSHPGLQVSDLVLTPPAAPRPSKQTRRKAPARAMPEGWQPRPEERAKARAAGVDVDAEAERFRDHHAAKGSVFADWDAAFRTWLGNAVRFAEERGGPRGSGELGSRPARGADGRPDPMAHRPLTRW